MRVTEIPFGSVGIDCLSPISHGVAKEIAAHVLPGTRTGITFVERYLENLTTEELDGLFAAGLGVAFVGEGRIKQWDAQSGATDAERALSLARGLGLPANASPLLTLACDLEGMVDCAPDQAAAYGTAWARAVMRGFAPEVYVGDAVPLSPMALYELPFVGYWRSLSNVQQVSVADFGIFQGFPTQHLALPSGPFAADCNFVVRDKKLRLPSMVVGA